MKYFRLRVNNVQLLFQKILPVQTFPEFSSIFSLNLLTYYKIY